MATTIGSLDLASLKNLRDDITQYFWFEPNARATYGAGAHVTLVPDTSFISNPTGQNILMNTDGFSIRNGLLPMMTLDNDSLDFNVVDTTAGTYTTTATFTSTGAQIGQSSGAHLVIDANGQRFYATNGTTQLANIGYGEGVDTGGGISDAPYYSLGLRRTASIQYNPLSTYYVGDVCLYDGKTYVCTTNIDTPEAWNQSHWRYSIGNYSIAKGYNTIAAGYASTAEGSDTTASGTYSHAEGVRTIASAPYSHAEGYHTTASGSNSHAEGSHTTAGAGSHAEGISTTASGAYSHAEGGSDTTASGSYSHAEGLGTQASGSSSHSQNRMTIAAKSSQTALGTYNEEDTSSTTTHPSGTTSYGQYAVIVGNGTADDARSNALTVDWNGKIQTSQMQAGTIAGTSVSANSYTDVSVTFSSEMSDVPIVVCSVVSTSTAGALGSITSAVTSTSTTGFTCRIFNAGSTARTPAVNWIALNV